MVEDTGAKTGAAAIRPLGLPQSIEVKADGKGLPIAVRVGRWQAAQVLDLWRIDDEWWRDRPISRSYYRLLLEDGRQLTAFQDLVDGKWCRQDQA